MKNGFDFIEQMEENVRYNMIFPYHINHEKLLGNYNYNKEFTSFHCHRFNDVIKRAYEEPKAFYLTEDDKKYYSLQELEFIEKIIKDESEKIDKGMVIVSLDLAEETIEMLEIYKNQMNMTTEEAIIDILTKAISEAKKEE